MSIIDRFMRIIRSDNTGNINTRDYTISDIIASSSEQRVSSESAMRISTVYSCIRVRAESLSMLPLRLYKILPDGGMETAHNHSLYKLLHTSPNRWMTAVEFIELISWCLDVYGNFYAYMSKVGDEVIELIPLSNHCVSCQYISGTNKPEYIITVNGDENKKQVKTIVCSDEQVLHIRLNAFDGLHGISPIGQVNRLMVNANTTEDLASSVYQNGAITSGVLSCDGKLDKETHKIIRDAFYENYVGSKNAGKPMILDGGLKYQQFRISLTDAQFIESRKYDRDEICGVFRIPPHLVANLDHATFSNIEQQNLQFVNYSLSPYIRRIEQRLNKQILPAAMQKRYRFKFDLSSLMRGDSASQVNYVKSLIDMGVITINDALEILGMNKCAGGDIRRLPLNTAYMDKAGKINNPNTSNSGNNV